MRVGRGSACAISLVVGLLAVAIPLGASAQDYPTRPLRMILATAPGGLTDILGRVTADHLSKAFGQSVVAENRAGASGNLGSNLVAKAAPDGYTLLVCEIGRITTNPWLHKNFPFDAMNDLVPVASIAEAPLLALVNPQLPANTLGELITLIKQQPGKISYGTSGNLVYGEFMRLTDTKMLEVTYRGMAPAVIDLVAGRINVMFIGLGVVASHVKAGKIRPLAVASKRRLSALPAVPTFDEAGVAGYDMPNWFGIFAPRGTPPAIVDRLNREVNNMLDDPAFATRFDEGMATMRQSQAAFESQVKAYYVKWGEIVRAEGVTPTDAQ